MCVVETYRISVYVSYSRSIKAKHISIGTADRNVWMQEKRMFTIAPVQSRVAVCIR